MKPINHHLFFDPSFFFGFFLLVVVLFFGQLSEAIVFRYDDKPVNDLGSRTRVLLSFTFSFFSSTLTPQHLQ